MDLRTLKLFDSKNNNTSEANPNSDKTLILHTIVCCILIATTQANSQQRWVSFNRLSSSVYQAALQSDNKVLSNYQNTTLLSSGSSGVNFTVHVDGMTVNQSNADAEEYQRISIPGGDYINKEACPQLPIMTQLIAIPDCDEVTISVTPFNEMDFNNYNISPAPGFGNKDLSEKGNNYPEPIAVNKSVYSMNAFYPGKYGEIIETGYLRSQKVARVAIYPIQFNPVRKSIKVFSDFNITMNFINPKSVFNKESGIFRNMLHSAVLNYKLNEVSASSKNLNIIQNIQPGKASSSGSVNRVNDVNLLTGPNALPFDYLIITHSSLFNSTSLSKLAEHRQNYNGFDVAIVQVDNTIYNAYPGRPHYQSIRDFISDVYLKGKANHTGDGHLGYIVLAGDAFTSDLQEMVPSACPPYYSKYEQGGDYYYACTGGDRDDIQDLIYGRIPVRNEGELSNVVNKTIFFESSPTASWQNNVSFMSYSPWFFKDDENCDDYFYLMAHIIPRSNYISYAWRGFAGDTSHAWGRLYFKDHPVDQASIASAPSDINEIYSQKFTGWRWYNYIIASNTNQVAIDGQYTDPTNDCGAPGFGDWIYNKLNEGQHFFIYEGHGGHSSLGAGEGAGRLIFRADQMDNKLHNYNKYPFIIANGCETGEFDNTAPDDLGSIDCLAEKTIKMKDAGAIGFLGSVRESTTSAFNFVDRYFLTAFYTNNSHVMGEAVMESKLLLFSTFRRQYNLYGDPAVNLLNTNISTSTGSDNHSSKIQTFELSQNYPNPFNPSTTITFQLPADGFISLKVYDVLGREVKNLVNGHKKTGKYSFTFDASTLASGVYFYRLESGSYCSIKKMILNK